MNRIKKLRELHKNSWNGIWAKRIISELEYLMEVLKSSGNVNDRFTALMESAIDKLWEFAVENGAITREIVLETEKELYPLQEEAKKYRVLLVGHAHIDMNWMWGFQETAAVTVDTFETVLKLMEEYPQFKFSQSQASVYSIIEEYYPELLEQIKKRIWEGRWEVTASTWVENDKNMSGSESMARHILYTKKYLSKLLDIDMDSLCLDFEPDTFGHNENMPEILSQGGIRYYYHCRGYEKEHIYRWQAPSGAEVLVYREPVWYNAKVLYDSLSFVPSFCKAHGLTTALKMYGVGDHGGGPTRRDLEHWMEMQSWPLMPVIKFGTLAEFFAELEKIRENLPVVKQELNYIFTGCYTSQARIKKANKYGEDRLFDAEVMDVMAHGCLEQYRTPSDFETSWRKILFNQFHDILPGSGTVETREYAMGEFQKSLAGAQINMNHAMRALCAEIDTEGLITEEEADTAFGAGAGSGTHENEGYMSGYVGRAGGKRRIVHVFNPTQYIRNEAVNVILWDWQGDPALIRVYDTAGKEMMCQISEKCRHYWDHEYYTVTLCAEVDAFGYSTFILDEAEEDTREIIWRELSTSPKSTWDMQDPRMDYYSDVPILLENQKIRASFAPDTMKMLSLYDKISGRELLREPSAYFREICEDTQYKMTSWRIGTYAAVCDVNETAAVRIRNIERGNLVQKISYSMKMEEYTVSVEIILYENNDHLDYHMEIDWHKTGSEEKGVPQLNFIVPFGYEAVDYACAVPFGVTNRKQVSHDVPCTGFMSAVPSGEIERGIIVMSDCKYGFRGCDNAVSVTLIRSSFDPDELPEQGKHLVKIGIGISKTDAESLTQKYECYVHPLYSCSNSSHKGKLPQSHSFLKINGNVRVTALKRAEDKKGMIVRMHSLCNEEQMVQITVNDKNVQHAHFTDVLERKLEDVVIEENKTEFLLPGRSIKTICFE